MARTRKVGIPSGGTTGQVLKKTTAEDYATEWGAGGGGGLGDVVGPGSSTNGAVVLYDGVTGKLIKNSTILPTTVGIAIANLANPSAVRFIRINADNSVTARTAAEMLSDLGGGGGGTWGSITGTLSAQTDLQTALDLKANLASPTFTGVLTTPVINEGKWTDIASAATTDLGAANGNYGDVTGTTTITAFGTVQAGTRRIVRFTAILTITYNATSLILPGAVSINTAVNDVAEFISLGSGNWRCTNYQTSSNLSSFISLTDTPVSYALQTEKVASVNSAATALEFIATTSFAATDFGSQTFLGLTDTPATFAAHAGKVASVNSGATALEFIATLDISQYFPVGVQDLYIRSVEMYPTITAGCAAIASTEVTNVTFRSLDFDQTTEENSQFSWVFPRNWDRGVIAVNVYWTAASGSGGVAIGIKGIALSDDDPLSGSFGTEITVTDTLITANDVHLTGYTANVTIGGTPIDADLIIINIARKVANGSDTLTADMKLMGVSIKFTLDAAVAE